MTFKLSLAVFFVLTFSTNAIANELSKPEFTNEEFILFKGKSSAQSIKIKTGDIAFRMGNEFQIAIGTYPIPKSFRAELNAPNSANWSLMQRVFNEGNYPWANSSFALPLWLEFKLKQHAALELAAHNQFQNEIPDKFRYSIYDLSNIRGNFKQIHLDEHTIGSEEEKYHNSISGFNKNYYFLNPLNETELSNVIHYYPKTSFVSHTGIISIEKENGVLKAYIYDVVPGKFAEEVYDKRFRSGFRKVTLEEFFGPNEARYGVISRVKNVSDSDILKTINQAWDYFYFANMIVNREDMFDYSLDWRQSKKVSCSSYVWRAYLEGANKNIVSNLSMTLLPVHIIEKLSGYFISINLQIAPQTILLSTKVDRIIDFDSEYMKTKILASSIGSAEYLPRENERNIKTGHRVYSLGE